LSAPPQPRRALAAVPAPVLVTGTAAAAADRLHEEPAGLTRARGPQRKRAGALLAAPALIAGAAPSPDRCRGQSPTARAGTRGTLRPWLRRPLAAVAAPVHGAARAATVAPLN